MRRKKSSSYEPFLYIIFPSIIVFTWIFYLCINWPFHDAIYEKNEIMNINPSSDEITINTEKINEFGVYHVKRSIKLSETVVYVDMWRSHWCTYYNDREFFFTPRINEICQRFREFGVPVVQISMTVDMFNGNSEQRRAGIQAVSKGNLSILEKFNAQAMKYHKDYIPGFVDSCVYPDQERFGKYRDNRFTKQIAVASSDYFVQNFKESAMSFVGLGAKHVIVLGQHTNMCLMAVFLYCREVGLDLIIVKDLVDSCWLYKYQKNHVKNHTAGNKAVNDYFEKELGSSVISYDLIASLKNCKQKKIKPTYTMFNNVAYMFQFL